MLFHFGTQVVINSSPHPSPLYFTASNWNVSQDVHITAVFDLVDEGEHVTISVAHSLNTTDEQYNRIQLPAVSVMILDDDEASVFVTRTNLSVAEGPGAFNDSFKIYLSSQPVFPVSLHFTGSGVALHPASITLTADNWAMGMVVRVVAIDDLVAEGTPHSGRVTHRVVSEDPLYDALRWLLWPCVDAGHNNFKDAVTRCGESGLRSRAIPPTAFLHYA